MSLLDLPIPTAAQVAQYSGSQSNRLVALLEAEPALKGKLLHDKPRMKEGKYPIVAHVFEVKGSQFLVKFEEIPSLLTIGQEFTLKVYEGVIEGKTAKWVRAQ
jgi:hypothetical protein